jgi:hypothetical protein
MQRLTQDRAAWAKNGMPTDDRRPWPGIGWMGETKLRHVHPVARNERASVSQRDHREAKRDECRCEQNPHVRERNALRLAGLLGVLHDQPPAVDRYKSHPRSAPSTNPISGAKGTSVVTLTRIPSASPNTAPITR